jgi:lysophospholipase L1-like esterase
MIRTLAPTVAIVLATAMSAGEAVALRLIPIGDPALLIEGAAASELIDDADGRRLRLHRPIDMPSKGYGWDNPGATLRFSTAARRGELRLRYSEKHVSTSARNGIGLILVDGADKPAALVKPAATTVVRAVELAAHPLPVPAAPGVHEYTYVMPYGDSVEVIGVALEAGATLVPVAERRRPRWVVYGDSVTHGFEASNVGATWPWLAARTRGWEVVNIAVGGRASNVPDAEAVVSSRPDAVAVAIGVNDWQGGAPVATYRKNLDGFLDRLGKALPGVPVAVITPLWVAPTWKPANPNAPPLAEYRAAAAAVAAEHAATVIDGTTLIDPDAALFARTAVHPNDARFAQMAARIAPLLPKPR